MPRPGKKRRLAQECSRFTHMQIRRKDKHRRVMARDPFSRGGHLLSTSIHGFQSPPHFPSFLLSNLETHVRFIKGPSPHSLTKWSKSNTSRHGEGKRPSSDPVSKGSAVSGSYMSCWPQASPPCFSTNGRSSRGWYTFHHHTQHTPESRGCRLLVPGGT